MFNLTFAPTVRISIYARGLALLLYVLHMLGFL
jgi:hypothetical protein